MKSVEGIDRMFLSGTVATFTMKEGKQPDAKALMEAVEKNKLEFVSLSMRKSQRAQAAWICKTPKLT